MLIAIGNDHTAVEMKNRIAEHIRSRGHEVLDKGTNDTSASDYPVCAEKAARAVADGDADCGVIICGTGVGVSITANKVRGIRAVCCSEPYSAMLAKQHNNANVLCFGARVVGIELAKMIVDSWLDAGFMAGRHAKRVDMIMEIEAKECGKHP
jgi:ribose 5-phosphate isomerase B